MSDSEFLQIERVGRVAHWTLNRPQTRNALDQALIGTLPIYERF